MRKHDGDYSQDKDSLENFNYDDKYSITGESSYSRDLTVPFDMNEVMSQRNYGYRGNLYGKDVEESDSNIKRGIHAGGDRILGHEGIGPRGYNRPDSSIYEEVCEILYQSPDIDASSLEVKVSAGIVSLHGSVEERWIKKLDEHLIENVSGVTDVQNEIRVIRGKRGLIQNITGLN